MERFWWEGSAVGWVTQAALLMAWKGWLGSVPFEAGLRAHHAKNDRSGGPPTWTISELSVTKTPSSAQLMSDGQRSTGVGWSNRSAFASCNVAGVRATVLGSLKISKAGIVPG